MSNQDFQQIHDDLKSEYLIVQNVLDGPLHITDLNLQLNPRECWEIDMRVNGDIVRSSRNLKNSLYKGFLVMLSEEQYAAQMEKQYTEEMKSMYSQDDSTPRGRNIDIDLDDPNAGQSRGRKQVTEQDAANIIEQLDQINNPIVYARKYKELADQENVDPYEFSQMVKEGAFIGGRRGRKMKVNMAQVYDPLRDTATNATYLDAGRDQSDIGATKTKMYNLNRDLAPEFEDNGPVENIDLADDFKATPGGFKRF